MIGRRKAEHMISCAFYMHERATDYRLDPEGMYVLGLLHDIGYLPDEGRRQPHELYGASFLRSLGLRQEMTRAIELHGADLTAFTPEELKDSPELVLLVEADSSVDCSGRICGFEERMADVAALYGSADVMRHNVGAVRAYCAAEGIKSPDAFFAGRFAKKGKDAGNGGDRSGRGKSRGGQ